MDWESHRFNGDVLCTISVRPFFKGREAKPEALAMNGRTVQLRSLWEMGPGDPYPGEWALGDSLGKAELSDAGIAWIASGDVLPVNE